MYIDECVADCELFWEFWGCRLDKKLVRRDAVWLNSYMHEGCGICVQLRHEANIAARILRPTPEGSL